MKVIGYTRVSSREQADEGASLEAQYAKLRAYCELYDLELVRVYSDPGFSAKTLRRPSLQQALAQLQNTPGLVVTKMDRLTRRVRDWAFLIEEYFENGCVLHSVNEHIDTRTATGRMVLNILMSVNQWERETIGERTQEVLQHKKANGQRVGRVPFGQRISSDGIHLEDDPAEQRALRDLLHLRRNHGIRQTAELLNLRGLTNRGRPWTRSAVDRLGRRERTK